MKVFAAGLGFASVLMMGWSLGTATVQAAAKKDEAAKPEFYTTKVQPILQTNCYRCHGGENHRSGLSIQTREGMLKGGHKGPALVPGDPAKSSLVQLIRHEGPADDPMPMPPKSPKMSDADIAIVERWIKAGAIMPDDAVKP